MEIRKHSSTVEIVTRELKNWLLGSFEIFISCHVVLFKTTRLFTHLFCYNCLLVLINLDVVTYTAYFLATLLDAPFEKRSLLGCYVIREIRLHATFSYVMNIVR
jgi:hypothetical protein